MSSEIVLTVENISKRYEIYEAPHHRLFQTLLHGRKQFYKEFWALKDVSFEIQKGECFGIIGQNGSGKSTLLEIIVGTLAPTSGSVNLNGKVSALLELGSGFNPEFTGRENVYMNGAVMGYSRNEMNKKIDDIASFADIGEFIDQPVKIYSSGMYVRLAFSAAINVDPDILIIDEALAVGDARFQKKCYDKLNKIRESGRTVLIVSHDSEMVKSFTNNALLLDHGRKVFCGLPKEAVNRYLQILYPLAEDKVAGTDKVSIKNLPVQCAREERYCLAAKFEKEQEKKASIEWIKLYGLEPVNVVHGGETLTVVIQAAWDPAVMGQYVGEGYDNSIIFGVDFQTKKGLNIFSFNTRMRAFAIDAVNHSRCRITFDFDLPHLAGGDYFLSFSMLLGSQAENVSFVWHKNLMHLLCSPFDKNIFCLMQTEYSVKDIVYDENCALP